MGTREFETSLENYIGHNGHAPSKFLRRTDISEQISGDLDMTSKLFILMITILGWLAWERFRCNVDCKTFPDTCIGEKLFLEQGERLAKDGQVFTLDTNINTDMVCAVRDHYGVKIRYPSRTRVRRTSDERIVRQ